MYIRRHLLGLLPRLIHLLSNPSIFHLIIPNLISEYFRVFGFSLIVSQCGVDFTEPSMQEDEQEQAVSSKVELSGVYTERAQNGIPVSSKVELRRDTVQGRHK